MSTDWEVNIKPNGVSIRTRPTQVLFDADGNEVIVPGPNHRQAIAASSFETPEAFTAHVETLMESKFGKGLQDITSRHMIVNEAVEAAHDKMRGERDEARADHDKTLTMLVNRERERDMTRVELSLTIIERDEILEEHSDALDRLLVMRAERDEARAERDILIPQLPPTE